MIIDLVWMVLNVLLAPLQLLPQVITTTAQFDAVVSLLTAANRVVDIPVIFGVVGVMIGVMAATTPMAMGFKLFKLVRG